MSSSKKLSLLVGLSTVPGMMLSAGCGSSSSTPANALSSASIGTLPSASSMAKTNAAAAAYLGGEIRAVTGAANAPIVNALSSTNVDTYFFGGLIATFNGLGMGVQATTTQKNQFYGNTTGGPGGMGACQMAQGTAESFSNLLNSANTLCYMKGIYKGPAGITVTGATAATVFDPGSADKLIRIAASNMTQNGSVQPTQYVYFKIYGNTGAAYKADVYMCSATTAGTTPNSVENISIDFASGLFTDVNQQNQGGVGSSTLTAYLKTGADGLPTFDETKDRHFVAKYAFSQGGQSGVYKADLTINSSNQIVSKVYRNNTGPWGTNTDNVYSIASFSGSSLKDLRFLSAGYNGTSKNGANVGRFGGGVEWQNSSYLAADNTLKTLAATVSPASDTFFTSDLSAATFSAGGLNCGGTPDVTVAMDFSVAGTAAIQAACDGDRISDYSMCYGTNVQNAQSHAWGN